MEILAELNWLAILQIILIDILLGGDNAVVIALACRNLPQQHRVRGILYGTAGAILLRVALISVAVTILEVPFLKLVGGALLLWIGVKLLTEEDDDHDVHGSEKLFAAVRTIIVADLVMSIDNVVAVASVAEHAGGSNKLMLVVFGIAVSIPIIIWGSQLVLQLMDRLPIIITFGAALLGYLGGAMMVSDVFVHEWVEANLPAHNIDLPGFDLAFSVPGVLGTILVVSLGAHIERRRHRQSAG